MNRKVVVHHIARPPKDKLEIKGYAVLEDDGYVSIADVLVDSQGKEWEILDRKEELKNIMRKAFWVEGDLWYVLKANSRCIRGDSNKEEVAHFYKGVGANMKSVLMDLMRNTFGEYYY